MSIIEKNFNAALEMMSTLVEKERRDSTIGTEYILVQAAYNPDSFKLYSASFYPSISGEVVDKQSDSGYYNMAFVVKELDEIVDKFADKFLFKLAYSDVSFALYEAYKQALRSENERYVLKTSFFKPSIEESAWAYHDVFRYSDLGHFRCWFSFDGEYMHVDIQADKDLINQYEDIKPSRYTQL